MVDVIRHPAESVTVDGGDAFSSFADTLDGGDAFTLYSPPLWYATIGGYDVPLTTTLSTLTGQSIPLMMTQYASGRTTQHVVHEILGRSDPDVTFTPTQTRSGSVSFLYESLALASEGADLLAASGPITLDQSDLPTLSMVFVVTGEIALAPDDQDADMWALTVPFREVIV